MFTLASVPSSEAGELLTRWTVRVAFVLYLAALAARLLKPSRWVTARVLWTAGAFAFLIHVACAFGFYHHWSHAEAFEATALRTAEVAGTAWGGGLYANYAFALVWIADASWWWRGLEIYRRRSRWLDWTVQFFMAFMFFNATVVFGQGAIRWMAVAGGLLLWLLWLRRRN